MQVVQERACQVIPERREVLLVEVSGIRGSDGSP